MPSKRPSTRPRTLRGVKLEALLAAGAVFDPDISTLAKMQGFILPDGRLVFRIVQGLGVVWPDRESCLKILKETKERRVEHVLEKLLPGSSFEPEMWLSTAHSHLELERAVLDFSARGIEAIDEVIRRRGRKWARKPEVFASLVAHVGEVLRRQTDGTWYVKVDVQLGQIEPHVRTASGHRINVGLAIWKGLLSLQLDLMEVVQIQLFALGLPRLEESSAKP